MSGLRVRRSSGPDEAAASMLIWSEHHGALGDFVPAQAQRWEKGERAITDYDDLPSDVRERAQRISLAYDEVHGIPTTALSHGVVSRMIDVIERCLEEHGNRAGPGPGNLDRSELNAGIEKDMRVIWSLLERGES